MKPDAKTASDAEHSDAADAALRALAARLGHTFADLALLETALTHSTFVHESARDIPNYERLEFLGDAVVGLVVSELLHAEFAAASEGELSRRRAQLVREASLESFATQLQLGPYVRLGHGQRAAGVPKSVLADVFEAIVGALFVDGGLDVARAFLTPIVQPRLRGDAGVRDAKTRLQEWCQRRALGAPVYELVAQRGPAHGRSFAMRVHVAGRPHGAGEASSKKAAEQLCAERALAALQQGAG